MDITPVQIPEKGRKKNNPYVLGCPGESGPTRFPWAAMWGPGAACEAEAMKPEKKKGTGSSPPTPPLMILEKKDRMRLAAQKDKGEDTWFISRGFEEEIRICLLEQYNDPKRGKGINQREGMPAQKSFNFDHLDSSKRSSRMTGAPLKKED